ncbi:MAG: FHA domain-containing protein [Verrucomicrobiia bacterium]
MPRLLGQSSELGELAFDLADPEITIGRAEGNAIRLNDGSVSSRHAVLTFTEDDYTIKDLNSTNGTRVNGTKIVQQKLQRGDVVHIGNLQFQYQSETGGAIQPLPEPTQAQQFNVANQSARPANFVNAAPFPKTNSEKEEKKYYSLLTVVGILAVLAVIGWALRLFILDVK